MPPPDNFTTTSSRMSSFHRISSSMSAVADHPLAPCPTVLPLCGEDMAIDDSSHSPASSRAPADKSSPLEDSTANKRPSLQPLHTQPNSADPMTSLNTIQQILHTISQQNESINIAMQVFHETLLQVPAQPQPVATAALEQVLTARGYSQVISNPSSPVPRPSHSGTAPPRTPPAADQYDGDNEDPIVDLDTMVKARQAVRKDKKKTALDNLYNVSRQYPPSPSFWLNCVLFRIAFENSWKRQASSKGKGEIAHFHVLRQLPMSIHTRVAVAVVPCIPESY
jgi:hypothetical protein